MTTDHVDALIQDVRDNLDASDVGLYEFIWILRGMDPAQSLEVMRDQAMFALQRLLDDGTGHLGLLVWPSQDVVAPYEHERLQETDWDDPRQGMPYVALIAP